MEGGALKGSGGSRGSEVQGHLPLCGELKASLDVVTKLNNDRARVTQKTLKRQAWDVARSLVSLWGTEGVGGQISPLPKMCCNHQAESPKNASYPSLCSSTPPTPLASPSG